MLKLRLENVETQNNFKSSQICELKTGLIADIRHTSYILQRRPSRIVTSDIVCNKAKERISKRMLQENKACQIFRETDISYSLLHTRTCAKQGVRIFFFSEDLACFLFLKHPFWDSSFYLIIDDIIVRTGKILLKQP